MKKWFALALALCLTLAAFPGLADSGYSKKLTISFASVQVSEGTDYTNGDDFAKWWSKKYNIEWDIQSLSWENWAEKLRVWINSGDMPDMATWNYLHSEMLGYVDQELVYKFPDDWKERWPNVAAAHYASIGRTLDEQLGGTYCLLKPIFFTSYPKGIPVFANIGVILRKDWAEAVGFPIKDCYKASELMEYARLIKAKDPGNTGGKVTGLEFPTSYAYMPFVTGNSTYCTTGNEFYIGADGKYQWGPASQDTLAGLKLFRQAYDEGLLNPEFFTLKVNEDMETFYVAGTAGVVINNIMPAIQNNVLVNMKANLGLDENAFHAAWVIGEDGKYHGVKSDNYWTSVIFNPDISQEKFERIMDMMEYSVTQEAQRFIRMGFEGIDWKYDESGNLVNLIPDGKSALNKYSSNVPVYCNMLVLSDDFGLINPAFPQAFRDMNVKYFKQRYEMSTPETLVEKDATAYFHSSPAMSKISTDYATEYAQLILKEGDLEANWKQWVTDKMALIQPVLDELNAKIGK